LREARKHQNLLKVSCGRPASIKTFEKRFAGGPQAQNPLKSDLRETRKRQTIWETTFAMRGNSKPFGKRLSQCAETSNPLRNELRKARKGYKQKKHSEEMNLQSAL